MENLQTVGPQMPNEPQKNIEKTKLSSKKFLIIAAVALVIVVCGIYFYTKNPSRTNVESGLTNSDWQTYTNKNRYGFQIGHPADWKLDFKFDDNIAFIAPNNAAVELGIFPNVFSTENWYKLSDATSITDFVRMLDENVFTGSPSPRTDSIEDFVKKLEENDKLISVMGNDAIQRPMANGTTTYGIETYLMSGDDVYVFRLTTYPRQIGEEEKSVYEKMLGTFKIIEPLTNIGYSPKISEVIPAVARPGSMVTIKGSGFTTRIPTGDNGEGYTDKHEMHLLFRLGTDFDITGDSDSSITFTVPFLSKGKYNLFMSNPNGVFTNEVPFEVSMAVSRPNINIYDEKLLKTGDEVLLALKNSDYDKLETLVSASGLSWNEYPQLDLTKSDITKDQISEIPTDTKTYLFGYTDGKGDPIQITKADYIKKWLYDRDYINAPVIALREILEKSGNNLNTLKEDSGNRHFIAYKFTGDKGFDWGTIYLFFDMEGEEFKLRGIAKNQWGI